MISSRALCLFVPVLSLLISTEVRAGDFVDQVTIGDAKSESAHRLIADHSEMVQGALGQVGRRLLPGGAQPWEGGNARLVMKVDPVKVNYFTARFWGDELNQNFLLLLCEGKQLGYRHLGDIDVLALPDDEPRYNGRFYYVTTPLPLTLTKGKSEVALEIRGNGPIWGYGKTFEAYQKPMTTPSRIIYRAYTHTNGCFVPPPDEKQGEAPRATVRQAPGPEVLERVKSRVNESIDGMLKSKRPLNQMQAQFLAKAYFVKWTRAFQEKKVLDQVVMSLDERYRAWLKDPKAVWADPATWNPDWFGLGPAGDAARLLAESLEPFLDQPTAEGKTRRAAWSEMFQSSRDWLRTHRRSFTNQTLFVDTNMYRSHRAVAAIDPKNAWPEEKAFRYLREAFGLQSWLGSDTESGSEKPWGDAYRQFTNKGLSRELGYVGGYGEILGQLVDAYDAVRAPGKEGDPELKAHIAKAQRARLFFRYPMLDDEGHRAMRLETGIGWRDTHFPGSVTYGQRSGLDETGIYAAAVTLDPAAVGAAQQMFEDNQFFESVAKIVDDRRPRALFGLLSLPDDYETLKALAPVGKRLPMSWDQPDVVFADEENGVVAIKHGEEILYVSLYWRAPYGINSLARAHYLTPRYQQVAVVRTAVKFESSGVVYKRQNWINWGFARGGMKYPGKLDSAHEGEELPQAKAPSGVNIKLGDNNPFAGRAEYYELRFGSYVIGMNATKEKTFELNAIPGAAIAIEIGTGKRVSLESPIKVAPRSTVVYHLEN